MKSFWIILLLYFPCPLLRADRPVTLEMAINELALKSTSVQVELLRLKNELLTYDNYKKEFLPALQLTTRLVEFNHSLKLLQNALDGNYLNVEDYSTSSSVGMTIQQKIFHTGGTFALNSSVSVLREHSDNRNNFTTTPFYVSYSQSFWGGRKQNIMERSLYRLRYDLALKNYCTSVSSIQQKVLVLYLEAFLSKLEQEQLREDIQINDTLLQIAELKLKEGYITEYDYNQIELQGLHINYAYENALRIFRENLRKLSAELGIDEQISIQYPDKDILPGFLNEDVVIRYIERNNPQRLAWDMQRKQAEYDLFQAQAETRFNGTISVNYGLNQYAEDFFTAYRHPNSQQNISVGLSIPVFQWGINRNKRKIARNEYEATLLEIEKSELDFLSNQKEQINNYNYAVHTYDLMERGYELACRQYQLAVQKFALGKISVYELTSTRQEQYTAMQDYYTAMESLYVNYYNLRHLSLYDFVRKQSLEELLVP